MQQPLVSVIVPVWNGAKTIGACLDSILAQTWQHLEVIVINDGSTDKTQSILEQYAAGDPRIRVFSQSNRGVAEARNYGIPQANGKWLRFVDADDILPPDSIHKLVTAAEEDHSDLAVSAFRSMIGAIGHDRSVIPDRKHMTTDAFLPIMKKYANTFYMGVLWNKLFRTSLVQEHHNRFTPGLDWGEDMVFVCDYLQHAECISVIPDVTYHYLRNASGLTAKQVGKCIRHPFRMIHMKYDLYTALRRLFVARGQYEKYRSTLWLYLISVTLNT